MLTIPGHIMLKTWTLFCTISIRPSIQFTKEKEEEGRIPYLDVLVCHNQEKLWMLTQVYCKPTHTDWYLHYHSYHLPVVKSGISWTFQESLPWPWFIQPGGCSPHFCYPGSLDRSNRNSEATDSIPFVKGVSERIRSPSPKWVLESASRLTQP